MIAKCLRSGSHGVEEGKEYTISKVQDSWTPYGPTIEPHCLVYPKSGKGNYLGIMPMSLFTAEEDIPEVIEIQQINIFDLCTS
jgi:hypothetical protein